MMIHTQVLVGDESDVIPDKLYWEDATLDLQSVMMCYNKPKYGSHVILMTGDQMVISIPYHKLKVKLDKLNDGNTLFFSKPKPN